MPAVIKHATVGSASSTAEVYEGYGGYNRSIDAVDELAQTVRGSVTQRTKRTWDGVFLPVSLSIFGFVLFARLPWMVGECGLWLTLVGIALCYTVTLFTTISLAAISTNGFAGDGGPYMMISRCLGPQIGTTVGLTFVSANAIATAMYLGGGVQIVVNVLDNDSVSAWHGSHPYGVTVVISSMMLLVLLVIAFAKVEKVFRVVCLALTLLSVSDVLVYMARAAGPPTQPPSGATPTQPPGGVWTQAAHDRRGDAFNDKDALVDLASNQSIPSAFVGLSLKTFRDNWSPAFSGSNGFQRALAVLFPGVSGLMSGVCLSGDLRNGAKAMPRGIAYAWTLSLVTYIAVAVLVAGSMNRQQLQTRYDALRDASDVGAYVPGEFVASFAAGLSMMVGSARVLRAIARDRLLPFAWATWLSKASTKRITLLYWFVIQLLLLLGDTYTDATIVATQVICANFMALNVSTFLSSATGIVSFRPVYAFFNTTTALGGALCCILMMFYINPLVAAGVLLVMGLILVVADLYIDPSKVYWGDASQPLFFYIVRKWLLRLDERKEHIRHWRPSVLHIVTDPLCSLNLVHVANNLKKGGLYELCLVVDGSFNDTAAACFKWKGWLMDFIATTNVKAFGVVTFGETLRPAVQGMLRTCGLGGMRPNTVLLSIDEVLQREYFLQIYDAYCGNAPERTMSFGAASLMQANNNKGLSGTQEDFGTVRPLKDVNNRATEFWDLKRDAKGNVISSNTKGNTYENRRWLGGQQRHCDGIASPSSGEASWDCLRTDERAPLLAPPVADTTATHHQRLNDRGPHSLPKRINGSPGGPVEYLALPPRRSQSLGRRESINAAESPRGSFAKRRCSAVLDPGADADELAATINLSASYRANRTVRFAESEPQAISPRHEADGVEERDKNLGVTEAASPTNRDHFSSLARTATAIFNQQLKLVHPSAQSSQQREEQRATKEAVRKNPVLAALLNAPPGSPGIAAGASGAGQPTGGAPTVEDALTAVLATSTRDSDWGEMLRSLQQQQSSLAAADLELVDVASVGTSDVGGSLSDHDVAAYVASTSGQHIRTTIQQLMQSSNVPQLHPTELGPSSSTAEGFQAWLSNTMRGHFGSRSGATVVGPAPATPPTTQSSSDALMATVTMDNSSMASLHGAQQQSGSAAADATLQYLQRSMERAHAMKKPFGWGLFRPPHTLENKVLEQRLLERMIAQRHTARLTGDCDLSAYADIGEFCNIARDAAMMQMSLLLARNMDKLDMATLATANKGDVFIDVWVPHETDAILFLMSYSFSMTSLWKKKGVLRLVSIVTRQEERAEETERLQQLMREHRLPAHVHVISLEAEMEARGLADPLDVVDLFSTQEGRAHVLNSLMRRELVANQQRTAMIFVRVESYVGPDNGGLEADDAAEAWFSNLVTLTHQLPPMLLLAAGSLKCRSNEW